MAAASGSDPVAIVALVVAALAAAGTIGQAVWVRAQFRTQKVALDLQQKSLDAQKESLAEQRAAFEQAKELWERSGPNIVISGERTTDKWDRRSDLYSFRIRNVGRLGTMIHEIFLDDLVPAGFGRMSLESWISLPRELNAGDELYVGVPRDELGERLSAWGDESWHHCVLEVQAGNGVVYKWNPDQGMDPDWRKVSF